jgi:hypothetical protein
MCIQYGLDTVFFVYLGGTIATKGGCDKDITNRLKKARGQFQRLKNFKIWYSIHFFHNNKN